jgi:hypothetical protein
MTILRKVTKVNLPPDRSKSPGSRRTRPELLAMAATAGLLVLGLIPSAGAGPGRSALRSLHALEGNQADRDKHAGGYYVGLIDGDGSSGRDELALRLLGKPADWLSFDELGVVRYLDRDLLRFELRPGVDKRAFGSQFTTDSLGLRDREYAREKPAGVFRVALLGSSMDMGWGVGTEETYENQFEDWLNAHAEKIGSARRFEVLNFAVAAYSPLHRLEAFERKVRGFRPDLVLYSATRLDTRLLEIHLVTMLQERADVKYAFVEKTLRDAGITDADLALDAKGRLRFKDRVKAKLAPRLWDLDAACVRELADRCRSLGVPMVCVIIPRASESDRPEFRGADVSRIESIARLAGVPAIDLTASFDDQDAGAIEIAPWDDHPNAWGHRLLFLGLGREVVKEEAVYRAFFDADPGNLGPLPAE